ncbi:MAG: fibronectin type III domain-containing protein [Actinomycetes bacterium]|jgi:hypothetical protein|nr:fibronectin type III domain-containing protein [Actinomycetes bacterium]
MTATRKTALKVLAFALCAALVLGIVPTAFATDFVVGENYVMDVALKGNTGANASSIAAHIYSKASVKVVAENDYEVSFYAIKDVSFGANQGLVSDDTTRGIYGYFYDSVQATSSAAATYTAALYEQFDAARYVRKITVKMTDLSRPLFIRIAHMSIMPMPLVQSIVLDPATAVASYPPYAFGNDTYTIVPPQSLPTTPTPSTVTTPAATTLKSVTRASYHSIAVSWNAVTGADGYLVQYHRAGKGWSTRLITGGAITSCKISGLMCGQTYTVRVAAFTYDDGGITRVTGDYSNTLTAKPTLSKITGVKTKKASYRKIKVTWSKRTGVSKYVVYRKVAKGAWKKVKTTGGTSYTTGRLTRGRTYYFRVRAYRNTTLGKAYSAYSASAKRVAR